jgi:hypothetical protein
MEVEKRERFEDGGVAHVPPSCDVDTHSSPRGKARILLFRSRLRRLCL